MTDSHPDQPALAPRWADSDRMNDLETALWRSERHPSQSSTVCTLLVLDQAPDWDRLVAAHEWATSLVPRSRQRVVEPLVPTGPPVWRLDRHFDLGYHLRRLHLGPRDSLADLLALCESLAMTPFDHTRPLWEGTLIEGLDGERAAYLLKLHHSLTDGLGAVQLMSLVQSRTRAHTPDKPSGPPAGGIASDDRLGVTLDGASATLSALPEVVATGLDATVSAVRSPGSAASSALRFAASLRRVLSGPPSGSSPLLRPRDGTKWVFRTLECPLDTLRAAGKVAGGSVNDAYVAALLGGLRRYHERHGMPLDELPVTVPVSLRRDDDPLGGNRFAGAMFAAPMGIEDPADRIAALRGVILAQLTEPALDSLSVVTPIVNRLPSGIGAALSRTVVSTDLSASNLPGLSEPVYMAGALVQRVYPFGPLPGVAIMAAMVSHVGTCCIGLNIDGTAVGDVEALLEDLHAGLAEVLAIAQ